MRRSVLTILLVLIISMLFAQTPLPNGKVQLNAGVGLYSGGIPVYVGFDVGVPKDFTVGGELSFASYYDDWHSRHYHHTVTGISGNFNYHFNRLLNITPKWDVYAGLNLGFYIWNSPNDYEGNHSSGLGLGLQVGGRYYFTDKFGINLEFGGGNEFSGAKFGISIRF